MRALIVLGTASLLVVGGCSLRSDEYDCPYTNRARSFKGDLAITESQASHDALVAWWKADTDAATDGGSTPPQPPPSERRSLAIDGEPTLDRACVSTPHGCVRIAASWVGDLTFRRPNEAGTYALRDLDAKVCEREPWRPEAPMPNAGSRRCSDVDGELVVREVVAPCPSQLDPEGSACARFDAGLTIRSQTDDAVGPSVSGSAQVLIYDETVVRQCTGGRGVHLGPFSGPG